MEPTHKVIAPSGQLNPDQRGIDLLQELLLLRLFRLSESALPGSLQGPQPGAGCRCHGPHHAGDFTLTKLPAGLLSLPGDLMLQDSAGRLELVQFVGPVKEEWLAALEAAGSPVHYVASNAYLVWTDAAGRSWMRSWPRPISCNTGWTTSRISNGRFTAPACREPGRFRGCCAGRYPAVPP
jgi:hypothetical protein